MATRPRYTVYDTEKREYLESAEMPLGSDGQMVTHWTRRRECALRFAGVKSAAEMVAKLGNYSEFVVKNDKGEVVA